METENTRTITKAHLNAVTKRLCTKYDSVCVAQRIFQWQNTLALAYEHSVTARIPLGTSARFSS